MEKNFILPGQEYVSVGNLIDILSEGKDDDKVKAAIGCNYGSKWSPYAKNAVLSKVAICFNVTSMERLDCENLFGGPSGNCPKWGTLSVPSNTDPNPWNPWKSTKAVLTKHDDDDATSNNNIL
jgi:hypothetical protein